MNELSRDCIECDAEECHNMAPQLSCRFCDAYYYCCEACRVQDDDHPCYSNEDETTVEQALQEGTFRTDQEAIESALNSRCGICLETTLIDPIVLVDCQHKFCTPCLVDWKSHADTCPYCRPDTNDLNQHRGILIQVLCRRASIASDDEKKRRLLTHALNCADELMEAAGRGPKTLLVKLKVQSRISGSEQVAIETAEEIQVLLDERQREILMMQCIAHEQGLTQHCNVLSRVLTGTHLYLRQVDVIQGQIYKSLHEWQEAIRFFERALQETSEETPSFNYRGIYWQLVRCYYENQDFDKAISTAQLAMVESRHQLEIHKYAALSYKANGDLYMAVKVMHQGALYTLDNGDRQKAYDLYEKLRRDLGN